MKKAVVVSTASLLAVTCTTTSVFPYNTMHVAYAAPTLESLTSGATITATYEAGAGVTAEYYSNGNMIIKGSGAIEDVTSATKVPWKSYIIYYKDQESIRGIRCYKNW